MKRVTITMNINTTGEAFGEFPEVEIASILRDLACKFDVNGILGQTLRDMNGNICGTVVIESDPGE